MGSWPLVLLVALVLFGLGFTLNPLAGRVGAPSRVAQRDHPDASGDGASSGPNTAEEGDLLGR